MTGASKAVNEPRGGPKGDRDGETLKGLVCQSVFTLQNHPCQTETITRMPLSLINFYYYYYYFS